MLSHVKSHHNKIADIHIIRSVFHLKIVTKHEDINRNTLRSGEKKKKQIEYKLISNPINMCLLQFN
ncbi:unnamed protein product [Paramecium octaurelia]|uniref:Uncharacterized protein n=1 Tax=Paramecium octaurelia TaxID=43137 RepID=A0A8S1WB17_PAROT|nr:unnamed protein product [Paramecium octaurelia]